MNLGMIGRRGVKIDQIGEYMRETGTEIEAWVVRNEEMGYVK